MSEHVVDISFRECPIEIRYDDDSEVFVGYCRPFNIRSQGSTEREAIAATQSAVNLYLSSCVGLGYRFMMQRGRP